MHKVEMRTKENGEQEEELVVSNLRPFPLKVSHVPHRCQPGVGPVPLPETRWRVIGLDAGTSPRR